jgi:hypothetical protein
MTDILLHNYRSNNILAQIAFPLVSDNLFTDNRKTPVQLPQVERMTFKYPSSPLLSQPDFIPTEMQCSEQCKHRKFCECLNIVRVPPNVTLDIVLIDEGMLFYSCTESF